jgi:hypothetical protein
MFDQQAHSSEGDTSDLLSVLRLAPMPAATRSGTIQSVRAMRKSLSGGPEITMEVFIEAVVSADTHLRDSLGKRHTQILGDCRRAIRAWADRPLRTLAIRAHGMIATLEDAKFAAASLFLKDCQSARKADPLSARNIDPLDWRRSGPEPTELIML